MSDDGSVEYALRSADGVAMETGTVRVGWDTRPASADFLASTGGSRLAIYDIISETMTLALGAPGTARPASLAGAASYGTK